MKKGSASKAIKKAAAPCKPIVSPKKAGAPATKKAAGGAKKGN